MLLENNSTKLDYKKYKMKIMKIKKIKKSGKILAFTYFLF